MAPTGRPQVVIVGCGFGGLAATKSLADAAVEITVIDRQNHHTFQPLLYQVATAGLNPSDIAQPIRHIIRKQDNARVVLDEVVGVGLDARTVTTTRGVTVAYDYLVLATGATHSYFGNDDWADVAPGLKTIDDALDIRRRILLAFERAETTVDVEERERQMTFVIVGAGPTGVELAGAVREIATTTLRADFRSIDTTTSRVVLIEAGPRVLGTFPVRLSASAERQLAKLGVEVHTSTRVTDIDARGVTTDAGSIPSATVLWGAGVAASPLGRAVTDDADRAGRVPVTAELTIDGHPDIAGEARPTFIYQDKGSMATIGRSKAVADLGPKLRFGGFVAWLLWCFVHVWSLIGFRSKVLTMTTWNWQYLTGRRSARLITGIADRRWVGRIGGGS